MHRTRPTFPIETERLVLRSFVVDDFEALLSYQSRPDVARYLMWEPRSEDEVRAALGTKIRATEIAAEGDHVALALIRKDSNQLVGDTILQLVDDEHRTGEIGFIVHPDHQGLGFASEAGRAILDVAFHDLDLHRVIGRVEARNAASARVLEILGMRREALFVENEFVKGGWQSELVYAILQREWPAARGR